MEQLILLRPLRLVLGILEHFVRLLLFQNCIRQISKLQLFDALEKFKRLVLLSKLALFIIYFKRVVFLASVHQILPLGLILKKDALLLGPDDGRALKLTLYFTLDYFVF